MTVHIPRWQQIAVLVCMPIVDLLRFLPQGKQTMLTPPDCDWHPRLSAGDIMQRRINGKWELRPMTEEEHRRYMADKW